MSDRTSDVRSLAANVVDRALGSRRPIDDLLQRSEIELAPVDRGLLRELVPADGRLAMSVSHATRARRPGVVEGVADHFGSVERVGHWVQGGAFLEHA